MPLTAGTRLGPYEVTAPLGQGGMGEVYRARDTRLGREVAIKVLPAHLSASPEVRARFEREARTASSLNHPHICTLLDVGRQDATDFLVMELLEGETLAQRLARGGLPLADVLRLGGQIADALDRAHGAGIVHRDLKPGNVMITRGGAKLMDFGLARAGAPGGPVRAARGAAPEAAPDMTTAVPLTAEGVIVGTFQYMAPEQLEGREADAASDVWALGCVLYEMATGRSAFAGASQASLISAIMKDTPRPMAELAPLTSPAFDRLVRACLAKRPDERWQSAHDLATALRWIETDGPGPDGATVGGGAAVTAAVTDVTYRQLTFRRGSITNARFAPDGRTVLYDAAWGGEPRRIYMTRTESPETTELTLPSAALLDVSTSGELAISLGRRFLGAPWLGTGMLAQAPMFGGAPRELHEGVYDAAWTPDGRELAVIRRVGLDNVLEFPIGNRVFAAPAWILGMRTSPDGRHVAFFDNMIGTTQRRLVIVSRDGEARTISLGEFWHGGLAWRQDGQELYFMTSRSHHGAVVQAVDLLGNVRSLARLMAPYATLHDVSGAGDLLLSRSSVEFGVGFSRPGQSRDTELGCFDFSIAKDLSADGRTLLFDEQGVAHAGELQISVRGTDGSAPTRLGPGYARGLSPDGKWAVGVHEGRLRVLPRGAGTARTLELGAIAPQQFATWHPDGDRIVFQGAVRGAGVRLFVVSMRGGAPRAVTPEGVAFPSGTIANAVSCDGARVFALTHDNALVVHALEGGPALASFPLEEDEEPVRWSADDHSIFFWRRGDLPGRVQRLDVATGARTPWREFGPADPTGVICTRSVVLTPDGETLAYTYMRDLSELFVARGSYRVGTCATDS